MEIFSFEQLREFGTQIALEHGLEYNSIVNDGDIDVAACVSYSTIKINYDLSMQQLLKKYPNDIAAINFYQLQLICHEIVHLEHDNMLNRSHYSREEIKNNALYTSLYNERQSMFLAQNYPKIYAKHHDSFIDEYIAEIVGSSYAIEFINRKISDQFTVEQLNKLNRRIAFTILHNYQDITLLNKVKITSPLTRFKNLANGHEIKLDKKFLAPLRAFLYSKIERDFEKFELNLLRPNANAVKHSEFEKIIYGEDTKLLDVIEQIYVGDIKTTNMFNYLANCKEEIHVEEEPIIDNNFIK